ncbi:MAG: C69 family dipeptidase [Bacteroidaceae bacterium]|nr:C69 family dipeptidase [Bacteroidaceae bacterium]
MRIKHLFVTMLALAAMHLTTPLEACTNLIVGKAASVDGSVICTYNCDGYGFAGSMSRTPGGRHEPGEKIAIRGWGNNGQVRGYIDQVEYTYDVIGYINEKQVSIVETTFDGRLELQNPEGLLNYDTMIQLGLQRAATARDAIIIMTDLLQEYGYNSTGETITVCDKNEAWILEIMGKGPGNKGAVWVAIRIPDDCICAHANISRIRQFPLKDSNNCLYSKDVISFARQKGYFSGKDEDFSFRDAYCPLTFENVRYADARVWSFFRHHVADVAEMDQYLPYINGQFDVCDHLPLYIKPAKKLSVRDIMNDMRDHFEGTPLDMTADMSAGPWSSPYRPLPMNWEVNGKKYFRERAIGTPQSGFTLVSHLRGWLPDDVGGVMYFNCDDANMIAYVPVYCGVQEVPEAFRRENNQSNVYSEKSAFWLNNVVANMIYPRYSVMIGDLRDAQKELEDFYAADQEQVLKDVEKLTKGEKATYLTNKTNAYTKQMMERWDKLFRLIAVKHNDQIVKPSENGVVIQGQRATPGYDQMFREAISKGTGDRYVMPENAQDIKSL